VDNLIWMLSVFIVDYLPQKLVKFHQKNLNKGFHQFNLMIDAKILTQLVIYYLNLLDFLKYLKLYLELGVTSLEIRMMLYLLVK